MYTCPVCGYDKLEEEAYDVDGNPSYEICKCCGFEFGYDDESEGKSFKEYRMEWIESGAQWHNAKEKPENWNVKVQLRNINVIIQ